MMIIESLEIQQGISIYPTTDLCQVKAVTQSPLQRAQF